MHSSSTGVVSESSSPTTSISAKEKLANTGGSEVSGKTPGAAASSEKHKRKGKERQVDARHDALADEEENKNVQEPTYIVRKKEPSWNVSR